MSNLPSKFRYLKQAQEADIKTPSTLFLSEKVLREFEINSELNKFIDQHRSKYYIVRSCISGEDGTQKSFAGHFQSSEKVSSKNLKETIKQCFKQNKKIQQEIIPLGKTNLMIQPFCEANIGGVLFSQWKYFSQHFLGEISIGGSQKAVEGIDSQFFLLHKKNKNDDLITLPNLPVEELRHIIQQCEQTFDFPMDIEWNFDGKEITVLQIRPITKIPQALKPADKNQIQTEKKYLQKIAKGNWKIDAFAESFGVISPLSFSVIKYCFEQSKHCFQKLGFRAEKMNFLAHSHNGQVYSNPNAQKVFFSQKSFTTPFWQAVNKPKYLEEIKHFSQSKYDDKFDFKRLVKIFGYWNIANVYAKDDNDISCISWTNEYEVLQRLNLGFPQEKDKMNWTDWRNFYKQWWLYEYEKLKKEIAKNPLLAFSEVTDLTSGNTKTLKKKYNNLLPFSILDFPYNFDENHNQKAIRVVKAPSTEGRVFVVKNPKIFRDNFPENIILVAPYFDNDWILEMDKFKGIILENGGILSHSAIVAREKNIPYFIDWKNATTKLKNGKILTIR